MASSTTSTVVGIDLGTTYSCVAAYFQGKFRVIANEQGETTTPSYVAFTSDRRLIGAPAKNQIASNAVNTVYDSKRLIGRKFNDPIVQNDMKNWSFKVVDDGKNNPKIQVNYLNEVHLFSPEEISSTVLTNVKQTAERFLRETVTDAVITVPAYFTNAQRQATKDAGKIAGLNVLQIINEPTAAAMAYGMEHKIKGMQIVLIYDLGGGTFDVSIVKIINGEDFEVKAVTGDNHLGGEDFDNRLVDFFADEFKRQSGLDVRSNARALRRLRTTCERVKRTLSSTTEASVEIDGLLEDQDFCSIITRSRFEMLCMDLFKRTIDSVEEALKDSKYEKSTIDEVVMVGGSTRIPKIQLMMAEFFDKKKINYKINPDEAVAYGAAVQAAKLSKIDHCELQNVKLKDVVSRSLSLKIVTGESVVIIKKNSKIPCEFTQPCRTTNESQTRGRIQIFEGEHILADNNDFLGEFCISGLTPDVGGKLLVTYALDTNSILTATAKEVAKDNSKEIQLDMKTGRLTEIDVERMLVQAVKHAKIDEMAKEKMQARNAILDYIAECEMKMTSCLSSSNKQRVQLLCAKEKIWLRSNKNVDVDTLKQQLSTFKELVKKYRL